MELLHPSSSGSPSGGLCAPQSWTVAASSQSCHPQGLILQTQTLLYDSTEIKYLKSRMHAGQTLTDPTCAREEKPLLGHMCRVPACQQRDGARGTALRPCSSPRPSMHCRAQQICAALAETATEEGKGPGGAEMSYCAANPEQGLN